VAVDVNNFNLIEVPKMAVIANITLKDSANAAKTYVPERVQTGVYASWVNRDQGTALGIKRASMVVRDTKGNYTKQSGKLVQPCINATTGLLDFTNSATFDVSCHLRATLAQKQELVNSLAAMLGLAPVTTLLTTGESISG
jgi:hypothetical protein